MKTAIALASLLLANAAYADAYLPPPKACKPPAVKINGQCTIVKEVVKEVPAPAPAPVVVTKEVVKEVPVEKVVTKTVEVQKESPWEVMAFARIGAHVNTHGYPSDLYTQRTLGGSFNNWGTWDVGYEFHHKGARLGVRTAVGNNGVSGILQVFPVQGRLNWYIGAGMAVTQTPFYRPTVPTVQRYFDVQVATGLEYAFSKHFVGLADLRAGIPLPWSDGAPLTWGDVGTSLGQTALMVGLGYRF